MQFYVLIATVCLLATAGATKDDDKVLGSSYGGAGYGAASAVPAVAPSYAGPVAPPSATSFSSQVYPSHVAPSFSGVYAPASIAAPPCPKNYVFSCQPNLAPVPCSASGNGYGSGYGSAGAFGSASGYGSTGAYSQYVPVYAPHPIHW